MKNVKELIEGNIQEYEELINLLYQVQDITKVDMEMAISILDDYYDGNKKIEAKEREMKK